MSRQILIQRALRKASPGQLLRTRALITRMEDVLGYPRTDIDKALKAFDKADFGNKELQEILAFWDDEVVAEAIE